MATLIEDNAYGTLASGLAAGDTTLNFTSGHGARFPTVAAPDVMYACILNTANVLEEVKITAHTANADSCTIVRGQGGTTAKVWAAGDRIEARISQQVLGDLVTQGTSALAVNVQGGGAGQVVYQVGTSSSGFSVVGTSSDIFTSNGTGAPSWISRDTLNVGIASTATTALTASTATTALAASTATNQSGGSVSCGSFGRGQVYTTTYGYTVTANDSTIIYNVNNTIYAIGLPTPASGRILHITGGGVVYSDANNIVRHSSIGVLNTSSIITSTATGGQWAILQGDGSRWYKIAGGSTT